MNTHAVYDAVSGDLKSEHPDANSAYAAAARLGGERFGYVVSLIGFPPDAKKIDLEQVKEKEPDVGPGLFD